MTSVASVPTRPTAETTAEPMSRQERRKARTRAAILDAAEGFFATDPESATIAKIAEAADVAVATVYQHFAGKDDLYLAVVERALAANEQHMMTAYDGDAAPVERLVDAVGAYLSFYAESPELFRLVALRQGRVTEESSSGPVAAVMADRVDRLTTTLAGVIEEGVADGSLRDVVPLDFARFIWGAMNGVIALALRPDRLRLTEADLRAAILQGTEVVFDGLVSDSSRGSDGRLRTDLRARLRAVLKEKR